MFQIAPRQVAERIEEQRQFDRKLQTLLERFDEVILKISGMQSLEEFIPHLRGLYQGMESQTHCAGELTLALERIRYCYEKCEAAILDRVENEEWPETEEGFACMEFVPMESQWESLIEFSAGQE